MKAETIKPNVGFESLNTGERTVLMVLAEMLRERIKTGAVAPSYEEIAARAGLSKPWIGANVLSLKRKGWLEQTTAHRSTRLTVPFRSIPRRKGGE